MHKEVLQINSEMSLSLKWTNSLEQTLLQSGMQSWNAAKSVMREAYRHKYIHKKKRKISNNLMLHVRELANEGQSPKCLEGRT